MNDYVLSGDPSEPGTISFFSLTPLQQVQLREWVMGKGFGVNWVTRVEVTAERVWIRVWQWIPCEGGSGWTRLVKDDGTGLVTAEWWEPSEDFPHPDLADALSFKEDECSAYRDELDDLREKYVALKDLCNRRGAVLRRIVERGED